MPWMRKIAPRVCGLLAALATVPALAPCGNGASAQREAHPASAPPADEGGGQTIRIGTKLVNVIFSVTDRQQRHVNDLTQGEVTVLEDGKPQQVFTFKREADLPLTMAVLVDTSNSVQPILPRLTEAGARFVDSVVRPGKDTAAVIGFGGEATLFQDLTTNAARLRRALKEIAGVGRPPGPGAGGGLPVPGVPFLGGTSIYDSVIAACEQLLGKEPGRKTVVLFTDGYDTTSRYQRGDAVEAALRAEAAVYAIGIGDYDDEGVDKGALNALCEPTGGRDFVPKGPSDLDHAFAELERDLRQQYLLAYEPANERADGRFRKIEVRTSGRKGLRIRHRRGYYAPAGLPGR